MATPPKRPRSVSTKGSLITEAVEPFRPHGEAKATEIAPRRPVAGLALTGSVAAASWSRRASAQDTTARRPKPVAGAVVKHPDRLAAPCVRVVWKAKVNHDRRLPRPGEHQRRDRPARERRRHGVRRAAGPRLRDASARPTDPYDDRSAFVAAVRPTPEARPSPDRRTTDIDPLLERERCAVVTWVVHMTVEGVEKSFHNTRLFIRDEPGARWWLLSWANQEV